MSPYIHPPFKIAASRRVRKKIPEVDGFEDSGSDVTRRSRVLAVEVVDEVGGVDVSGRFPGVVFGAESLPLDEVLKAAAVDPTVEDAFDFPFFLVVDDDWVWWR